MTDVKENPRTGRIKYSAQIIFHTFPKVIEPHSTSLDVLAQLKAIETAFKLCEL